MIYRKDEDERRFVACRPFKFEISPIQRKSLVGPFVLTGCYRGFDQPVILGTFIDREQAEAVQHRERVRAIGRSGTHKVLG
jgi:hypothetical protein